MQLTIDTTSSLPKINQCFATTTHPGIVPPRRGWGGLPPGRRAALRKAPGGRAGSCLQNGWPQSPPSRSYTPAGARRLPSS
jgi:hypothetical protein